MNVINLPEQNMPTSISRGELFTLVECKRNCIMYNRKHKCEGEKCSRCSWNVDGLINGLNPYQRQWVETQAEKGSIDMSSIGDKIGEVVGAIVEVIAAVIALAMIAGTGAIIVWFIKECAKRM